MYCCADDSHYVLLCWWLPNVIAHEDSRHVMHVCFLMVYKYVPCAEISLWLKSASTTWITSLISRYHASVSIQTSQPVTCGQYHEHCISLVSVISGQSSYISAVQAFIYRFSYFTAKEEVNDTEDLLLFDLGIDEQFTDNNLKDIMTILEESESSNASAQDCVDKTSASSLDQRKPVNGMYTSPMHHQQPLPSTTSQPSQPASNTRPQHQTLLQQAQQPGQQQLGMSSTPSPQLQHNGGVAPPQQVCTSFSVEQAIILFVKRLSDHCGKI